MELKNLLNVEGNELIIRQGDALPLKEPVKISIDGQLSSILNYLINNTDHITPRSMIVVNRDFKKITYYEDPQNVYGSIVIGILHLSKEFKLFGINSGDSMTTFEIADLIRMNRSCFEDKTKAAELVTILRSFKAKVDKDVENSDDKRGNITLLRRQAVESNLPGSFNINIPLFKGMGKEIIEIEIDINPDDLTCSLVSPQAAEIIQTITDGLIEAQLKDLKKYTSDYSIPVIEV
jgi:hypothetical protein